MGKLILVPPLVRTSLRDSKAAHVVVSLENSEVPLVMALPTGTKERVIRASMARLREQMRDDPAPTGAELRGIAERTIEHYEGSGRPHEWGVVIDHFREIVVDPLVAEVLWRVEGCHDEEEAEAHIDSFSAVLEDDERPERFWNWREEIEEWVAASSGDVLVQRRNGAWLFVPTVADDGQKLHLWFREPKRHVVDLAPGKDAIARHAAIIGWARKSLTGQWMDLTRAGPSGRVFAPIRFLVRDQKDAVMLKLRWSDPEDADDGEEADA